jgi:glucose-6-phosphate isomerase
VGNEYFMTRGHFHARREQGEVYFGLRGSGLLLLQDEQGQARFEQVFAGSVHIIPGFTAHRLINTGAIRFPRWRSGPASRGTITQRWQTALRCGSLKSIGLSR